MSGSGGTERGHDTQPGYEGPGIYRHYKGGYYRVVGVSKHESTGAKLVIYHSYSIEHDMGRWMDGVDFVARPLNASDGPDAFNDPPNERETGDPQPRFWKADGSDVSR